MKKIALSIVLLLASLFSLHAVPAYPHPITVRQPDGTVLTIRIHGDEFLHWTTCGDNLVSLGPDGYYQYASFSADGIAVPQGTRIRTSSSGDGSKITPPASAIAKANQTRNAARTGSPSNSISMGEKHFLVLLIQFSDTKFTISDPATAFGNLLNSRNYTYNGATGSVWKYYNDNSHDKFSPIYDIYGPITVSGKSADYADDDVQAVIEACNYADKNLGVDFSQYCYEDPTLVDNIFYYFAGYNQAEGGGSDTIWPHSVTYYSPFLTLDGVGIYKYACSSEYRGSSGQEMAGIGTFTHEFGHTIGLPDVYDVDYSSHGSANGLGPLSLMSSGNYNNDGRTPPYLTYEERHTLGWDDGLTLLSEGNNTLRPIAENKSYYTPTSNEGEYYLYESRPCTGWDAYTGAPGMAIYHVDRSGNIMPDGNTAADMWGWNIHMINAYAEHQCYDLIESVYPESKASYTSQLLVFPGLNNVTSFTSQTLPGALAWSGNPTGYNLTDISFSSGGVTTLRISKEYRLCGIVSDASGNPICGAKVKVSHSTEDAASTRMSAMADGMFYARLSSTTNAQEYELTSDEKGCFELQLDAPGTCHVSVEKEGYMPYSGNVSVEAVTTVKAVLAKPDDAAAITLQKFKIHSDYVVGLGEGTDIYAGFKYLPEELTDYVGHDIRSISFNVWNGGYGTVDKMGVRVYFDDVLQCDCESKAHIFGSFCTVDISDCRLKIPNGKSVFFVYYVLNPSYPCTCIISDYQNSDETADIWSSDGSFWWHCSTGNFEIRATLANGGQVINLSGINYIARKPSYSAGDKFELKLVKSSVNSPSAVTWSVNGETKSTGDKVTLYAGKNTIRAVLEFSSGRKEIKEIVIDVK